jgi:hypothetical protein
MMKEEYKKNRGAYTQQNPNQTYAYHHTEQDIGCELDYGIFYQTYKVGQLTFNVRFVCSAQNCSLWYNAKA